MVFYLFAKGGERKRGSILQNTSCTVHVSLRFLCAKDRGGGKGGGNQLRDQMTTNRSCRNGGPFEPFLCGSQLFPPSLLSLSPSLYIHLYPPTPPPFPPEMSFQHTKPCKNRPHECFRRGTRLQRCHGTLGRVCQAGRCYSEPMALIHPYALQRPAGSSFFHGCCVFPFDITMISDKG